MTVSKCEELYRNLKAASNRGACMMTTSSGDSARQPFCPYNSISFRPYLVPLSLLHCPSN